MIDSNAVVLLSFAIFIGILVYYKVPKKVLSLLDQRSDKIAEQLEEARKLREQAQSLLAECERKQRHVDKEIAQIASQAEKDAERVRAQGEATVKDMMARYEKLTKEKIARMEKEAKNNMRQQVVTLAMEVTQQVLVKNFTPQDDKNLIDKALKDLNKRAS